MDRLTRPVNIMSLEHPTKFFIDCPIDVYPGSECRRIEVPRELARYITSLQDQVDSLEQRVKDLKVEGAKKKRKLFSFPGGDK